MVLAGLGLGLVATALVWRMMRSTFVADVFDRVNHRGRHVPTAVGVVLIIGVLGIEAVLALAEAAGQDPDLATVPGRRLVVLGGLAFALLGLLDDLAGAGESLGFRGHLRSLARGQLTTGGVKLFGGAAIGVVLAASFEPRSVGRVLADGALIALCANLANLFDRAPGRTAKVSLLCFAALALATGVPDALFGPAFVFGGVLALLMPDLREELMLGDTGSNVIGAALGVGLLVTASPTARSVALVVVLALNLLSEVVSFSKIIGGTPGLRELDALGRRSGP
jgi:UDP-N-acetylmuramyl pentapeptide phosphotransferase/UDP-N-acetylglucosamine-1-phosphate transferase